MKKNERKGTVKGVGWRRRGDVGTKEEEGKEGRERRAEK